ncbi:hypothetical protein BAE44_0023263, partial [Dichanthelium oligosanthes]
MRSPPASHLHHHPRAMDLFPDGAYVRLRSGWHETYLHADEDGVGVSLRTRARGPAANGVWRVHRVQRRGIDYVLLHGAAYGRYLALSPRGKWGPSECVSFRVVQRGLDNPEQDAIMWSPKDGGRGYVLMSHLINGLLRANGRLWNADAVSVDYYFGTLTNMRQWRVEFFQRQWRVEVVQPTPQGPPPL